MNIGGLLPATSDKESCINGTSGNSLDALNADTVVEIFRHLPIVDRFRMERVCKQWSALMPYADLRSFDLFAFSWKVEATTKFTYNTLNVSAQQPIIMQYWFRTVLCKFLEKIGLGLRELNFSARLFHVIITSDILETILSFCPFLRSLSLGGALICEDVAARLGELQFLRSLTLGSCVFLNDDLAAVVPASAIETHLTSLVENLHLEVLNLASLYSFPKLRSKTSLLSLSLFNCPVSDSQLRDVSNFCPNLRTLNIGCCSQIRDFIPVTFLRELTWLWIHSTKLTNADLERICRCCNKIQTLRIDSCEHLTDYSCLKLLRYLVCLWVGPSHFFTDRSLIAIAGNRRLENVNLMKCSSLSDAGVSYLAANCVQLRELNLLELPVTDQSVLPLLHNCSMLEYLNLEKTGISNDTISVAGSHCRKLSLLVVRGCQRTDEQAYRLLLDWRTRQMAEAEDEYKNLTIVIGGTGATISNALEQQLNTVGVTIQRRDPLLALPST